MGPKTPRTPWEIEAWSGYMEKRGPESDGETLAFFAEYVGQHTKTRKDIRTWFEAVDLDDYVSSRRITPNRAQKSMPINSESDSYLIVNMH